MDNAPSNPHAVAVQPVWPLLRGFLFDLLIVILVFVVVMVGSGFGLGILGVAMSQGGDIDGFMSLQLVQSLLLAAAGLGMVVAALLPYLWRRRATRGEIAQANAALARPSTWAWVVGVVAALQAGSYLLDWLDRQQALGLEPSNAQPIMELMAAYPVPTWLYVVLLAPVVEELLFRRVMFGRFLEGGRPLLGYVVTGATFASFHEFAGLSQGGWLQTALLWGFYFLMAVALAWVYQRTRSLWAPILVHAANNGIAMWWMSAA